MSNKSDNCFIYGERDDSELFYQASDLVIHSSTLELNPLVIKEATSYDLPVLLNKLDTYLDMYDSYKNIKYLTMNVDQDSQYILDNFNIKRKDDDQTFKKNLIEEYKNTLSIKSNNVNIKVENDSLNDTFNYNINFIDGARVEILGNKKIDFDVEIFDKNTNDLIYKTTIPTNNWCATNTKFYREYKIDIKHNNQLLISHIFNLENKNVLIQLDSKSIGDTLAWFPYVEEFRKKHNCNVYCITFWNNWFIDQYPRDKFFRAR